MKSLSVREIRKEFLHFFQSKDHYILKSHSLIPFQDNSLLLINSGMAPLKNYFTGKEIPPKKRVASVQKCIRTDDIENVGKTDRHATFFEMLGNFSFGDYFKEEAIAFAWEFLSDVLQIPKELLYISVYEEDLETYDIWKKIVDPSHIVFLGKKDNFWEIGVGPCGPCSEIYYDRGASFSCGKEDCAVGCDCERYIEIWNLVFTQFYKTENGSYENLQQKNIDTGMGLERIASVLQAVPSIFDTDCFQNLIDELSKFSPQPYAVLKKTDESYHVICDHIRSIVFLIADGVMPSNEGRGYVLRRLIRRALRHGKLLNIQQRFLIPLANKVIEYNKDAYENLEEKRQYIHTVIQVEEQKFNETLDKGLGMLDSLIKRMIRNKEKILSGLDVFKLYDTYGFPVDLTKEILSDAKLHYDHDSFIQLMQEQRRKAKDARKENTYMGKEESIFDTVQAQTFYYAHHKDALENAQVLYMVKNNQFVDELNEGDEALLILDKTVFYYESGGQTSDTGILYGSDFEAEIRNVQQIGSKIIHQISVRHGQLKQNDALSMKVDSLSRNKSAKNHSAAHLLHKALKEVLGNHAEQQGSFVSENRLRFDFSHFEALTNEQLQKIENIVNHVIDQALPVSIIETDLEHAKEMGAVALFNEKYKEQVRVIQMGDFSMELCGGIHVKNTSEIGVFKIVSENGIASGIRRIEAVTSTNLLQLMREFDVYLHAIEKTMKSPRNKIIEKMTSFFEEFKVLQKELSQLKAKQASSSVQHLLDQKKNYEGITIVIEKIENADMEKLKLLGDELKQNTPDYFLLLIGQDKQKLHLYSIASESAVNKGLDAGKTIQTVAKICQGKGGGRKNMGQGAAFDASKVNNAIETAENLIKETLTA